MMRLAPDGNVSERYTTRCREKMEAFFALRRFALVHSQEGAVMGAGQAGFVDIFAVATPCGFPFYPPLRIFSGSSYLKEKP
jgi:hypothetical protein